MVDMDNRNTTTQTFIVSVPGFVGEQEKKSNSTSVDLGRVTVHLRQGVLLTGGPHFSWLPLLTVGTQWKPFARIANKPKLHGGPGSLLEVDDV